MSVVLFSNGDDKSDCSRIQAALKSVCAKRSLEVFTKFEDFSLRVRRLPINVDVAVLSVQNDYQLTALLSLADYLDDVQIILIMPDRNGHMLSKGHRLHPRFLTYSNGDFSDIAAVLSKMLRNKKNGRQASSVCRGR
jgi:hypothetical protein